MSVPRPFLLHGVVGGSAAWGPMDGRFPGAAVVALPGHGGGAPVGGFAATVDLLGQALGRLPGPRAVVGQDLGAALALGVAAAFPEVVDGVVAIGCGASLPVPAEALEHALDDPAGAVTSVLGGGPGPSGHAGAMLAATRGPALAHDLGLCAEADLPALAARVRCPVLMIAGSADRWTPPESVEALARALPSCALILVPDAGHLVQADAPATVNLVVAAFLARLELTLAEE